VKKEAKHIKKQKWMRNIFEVKFPKKKIPKKKKATVKINKTKKNKRPVAIADETKMPEVKKNMKIT
jgi:hypothetical protein